MTPDVFVSRLKEIQSVFDDAIAAIEEQDAEVTLAVFEVFEEVQQGINGLIREMILAILRPGSDEAE